MWKKGDTPPEIERSNDRQPQREISMYNDPNSVAVVGLRSSGQAVIGRSITIKGEVTGDEDLVIEGRVDGSVDLQQHAVTVGPEGQVKANLSGRIVTVEGRVEGNVTADDQVVLRRSSWVKGDIRAPRVVLDDGAHFRGGIFMGEDAVPKRNAEAAAQRASATEPSKTNGSAQPQQQPYTSSQPQQAPARAASAAPATASAKAQPKG